VHEFGIDTAKWVDVEPVSVVGKACSAIGRVSVNVKLNQIITSSLELIRFSVMVVV
jgi:hypothetical protein